MEEISGMDFSEHSTNSSASDYRQQTLSTKAFVPSHYPLQDRTAMQAASDKSTIKLHRITHVPGKVQVRVVPVSTYSEILTTATTRSVPLAHSRRRPHPLALLRNVVLFLLVILAGGTLLTSDLAHSQQAHTAPKSSVHSVSNAPLNENIVTNGATLWDGDTEVTTPTTDFSAVTGSGIGVSPIFAAYYTNFNGTQTLGNPVTVAFPTNQGWMQFFQSGALLAPAAQRTRLSATQQTFAELLSHGLLDPNTGVIRLPLLQSLLTLGSQAPVAGAGSSLTFADLRQATDPSQMLSKPVQATSGTPVNSQGVFIEGGTRNGHDVGHFIPQIFWNYITRPDIAPDGWQTDFGSPLTEALPFTLTENGTVHQMLVQLFLRDGVILDTTMPNSSVQRLQTGIAYLDTAGTPDIAITAQQSVWAQGQSNPSLLNAPASTQTQGQVAQNFPLTLLGDTSWQNGMLWYHVQWTAPKHTGTGWLAAQSLSFTSPGSAGSPVSASMGILSPDLASYLAGIGNSVGVTVYDITRQRYYTYNENTQFAMASSMKVPIMLTFLDGLEQQGREPNDQEMQLLTTMIENSNNDSATALYDEEGDAAAVSSYMQKVHVPDMSPEDGSWGYSLITPLSMVKLLTLLYQGKVLTDQDRKLALNLMEHIESDQQVGVGSTAPGGATVAMKDGWVTGPDGLWVMNSSGIVTVGKETYIISVYTADQNTLQDGQAISEHVCSTIASILP